VIFGGPPVIIKLCQGGTSGEQDRLLKSAGMKWSIHKLANRVSYTRQVYAARTISWDATTAPLKKGQQLAKTPNSSRPAPELVACLTAAGEKGTIQGMSPAYVDDISRGLVRQGFAPRGDTLSGLNRSQQEAVKAAVSQRLTLIQGPPGTGKTATAIKIIKIWTQLGMYRESILATSDSNVAVDNLLEGCIKAGIRAVRLGKPENISEHLKRYCVDFMAPEGTSLDRTLILSGT